MELLIALGCVFVVLVLGSGWLVLSIYLGFLAADFGESISKPVSWFFYLTTVSCLIVGGIMTFGYVMHLITGMP